MLTILPIQLLPEAKTPSRAHRSDSGLDLYACFTEEFYKANEPSIVVREEQKVLRLDSFSRFVVPTGVFIDLEGYCTQLDLSSEYTVEAQVRPTSGNAAKKGITVLNTPGTIDTGYRGEIKVILYNTSHQAQFISHHAKIAQLVLSLVLLPCLEVCSFEADTERGSAGFGSTGTV